MKLEETIERLKDDVKYADLRDTVDDDCTICFIEDVETVLQELEHLQKENKGLISEKTKLLLTDLSEANKLYDEENKRCMMFAIENNDLKEKLDNSISKDKIREKIKEYKNSKEFYQNFPDDYMGDIAISLLQDLLKEE